MQLTQPPLSETPQYFQVVWFVSVLDSFCSYLVSVLISLVLPVSWWSPGWIHIGLIVRDVSLTFPLSCLFSVYCFIEAVHFSPSFSLYPLPTCLSVILTFTLRLSVRVSLSPPLYFLLSSWHCFCAEVSVDSSHIFSQPFFLLIVCSQPPCPTCSHPPVPSPGPNQTTHHSQKGSFHNDTAHCTYFFSHLDHSAISMVLSLSRTIFWSVRDVTLHVYDITVYLGIRLTWQYEHKTTIVAVLLILQDVLYPACMQCCSD